MDDVCRTESFELLVTSPGRESSIQDTEGTSLVDRVANRSFEGRTELEIEREQEVHKTRLDV